MLLNTVFLNILLNNLQIICKVKINFILIFVNLISFFHFTIQPYAYTYFSDELMLQYQISTRNESIENDGLIYPFNNFNQSLLIEIAYQHLPPSGLSIPIPKIIRKTDWNKNSFHSEHSLPNDINLNEYDQTFSYIRWYQLEESIITFNLLSTHSLYEEIKDLIDDDNSETS